MKTYQQPIVVWMPRNNIDDKFNWVLMGDIDWYLSNGEKITIPKGMRTDLALIPEFLWSFYSPFRIFLLPMLIRYYLMIYEPNKTLRFINNEMLHCQKLLTANKFNIYTRYYLVHFLSLIHYYDIDELKNINL